MTAFSGVTRHSFVWLLGAVTTLGGAHAARAVPTFQIDQIGTSIGPIAVAAAPPSANATFTPSSCPGGPPCALAGLQPVADLNGDNIPDLVTANSTGDTVSIFFGGTGGYPTTPSRNLLLPSGSNPQALALGDFNNDGVTDIAVSNNGNSTVSIFLGHKNTSTNLGDGTFRSGPTLTGATTARGIAVGRFRGPTANLDIAVVINSGSASGNVRVYLGNGDGTFAAGTSFSVGDHPQFIVLGDFGTSARGTTNGAARDNKLDIAVTVQGADDNVSILYGNGSGGFSAPDKYAADGNPNGIVAGDFNNDGCVDAVTANAGAKPDGTIRNVVSVLLGTCSGNTGSLQDASAFDLGTSPDTNPFGIAAVQLNGDANLDLAVTQSGITTNAATNKVALLRNDFNPALPNVAQFAIVQRCDADTAETVTTPKGIAALDFNGDGKDDLAVANNKNGINDLAVITGDGVPTCPDANVMKIGNIPPATTPVSVALCDVSTFGGAVGHDNNLDLLILDQASQAVVVFGGDGQGNFRRAYSVSTGTTPTAIACGHNLNGDGCDGFGVANQGGNNAFVCSTGNGTDCGGPVSCNTVGGLSAPNSLTFTDLDGAAPLDSAIVEGNNTVNSLCGGSFGVDAGAVSIAAGILNATQNDLAVAPSLANFTDFIFNLLPGSCVFSRKALDKNPGNVDNFPFWVAVGADLNTGDLDKNGHLDVVTANKNQRDVTVLLGLGGGGFASAQSFYTSTASGSAPDSAVTADFDLDGNIDVAVADTPRNKVLFLAGNGAGSLTTCSNGSTCEFNGGTSPVWIQSGNLNQLSGTDTKPDLVVVNKTVQAVTIMLNTTCPANQCC